MKTAYINNFSLTDKSINFAFVQGRLCSSFGIWCPCEWEFMELFSPKHNDYEIICEFAIVPLAAGPVLFSWHFHRRWKFNLYACRRKGERKSYKMLEKKRRIVPSRSEPNLGLDLYPLCMFKYIKVFSTFHKYWTQNRWLFLNSGWPDSSIQSVASHGARWGHDPSDYQRGQQKERGRWDRGKKNKKRKGIKTIQWRRKGRSRTMCPGHQL